MLCACNHSKRDQNSIDFFGRLFYNINAPGFCCWGNGGSVDKHASGCLAVLFGRDCYFFACFYLFNRAFTLSLPSSRSLHSLRISSIFLWLVDKTKTLNYTPASDEMVITAYRWFANKVCPGDWLYSRLGELAKTVTDRLNPQPVASGTIYRVQIGAFAKKENAEALAKQAQAKGFTAAVIPYVKGDIDGDGKVTAADAREALRIATGQE